MLNNKLMGGLLFGESRARSVNSFGCIILFTIWIAHVSRVVHGTVKREYLAAIIFGGFSNMAIWQRINLAISHTGNI